MKKEKTTKSYKEYTLEELQDEIAKLDGQLGRQHGREGQKFDDPDSLVHHQPIRRFSTS